LGRARNADGKPTKILYIHHTFRNQSGSVLLWNIAKRINRKKYKIFAACLREGGPYEDKLRNIGVTVKNFDLKTLLDLRIIPRLVRYIKQNNIDIVETAVFPSDVYGRVSARLANVPVIISTMHRVEDHKQETIYRFLPFVDMLTMALTTRIIAVSGAVKNYLIRRHKIRPEKISVIYNGIDVNKYKSHTNITEFKKQFNLEPSIPIVAFIGRLVKVKGVSYFLEATASVLRSGKKAQFLVVGDGPLKQSLVKQTQKLGIEQHVFFIGFRKDIPKILSLIDILVVPSLWEGLPLTILETMSAGKPIIAARVGGIPEAIKNGETGILVPPKNPEALSGAINDLLAAPKKRKEMGEKAKQRALQLFDVERMVKEYENLYDACAVSQTGVYK